jgi:hypothetical protein
MGAFSDRWTVFTTALGSRRYAVADIAKLAVLIATAAYLYVYGRAMTSWEIALAVTTVLFILFFWVMLEYALKLTRQIADARVRIAELRHEGVRIRNDALGGITDGSLWTDWEARALAWNQEVISEMEKISKSDAVWFSVLDIVPSPRIWPSAFPEGWEPQFLKLFREHDFRVRRLGEMIRDLWGRA